MMLAAFGCWFLLGPDRHSSRVEDRGEIAGKLLEPELLPVDNSIFYRKDSFESYMSKALIGKATFDDFVGLLASLEDNCTRIVTKNMLALQKSLTLPQQLVDLESHLKSVYKGEITGHAGLFPGQQALYVLLSRQPWVRQVCEIGFNAGHSALFWLVGNDKVKLVSFDIAYVSYIKPMGIYVDATFPRRLQTVWGDSKVEVSKFFKENNVTCDVIVIDGSHVRADVLADLRNMRAAAASPRHLIILDDFLGTNDIGAAVIDARKEHLIGKLADCLAYPDTGRGMAFTYYRERVTATV